MNNAADTNGGAINNAAGSSPEIKNCVFYKNTAAGTSYGGGAIYNSGSSPDILNCVFLQNSVSKKDGGAIYNSNSSPNIRNCTFAGNSTPYEGSVIYNTGSSSPVFINNIIWNNSGKTIFSNNANSSTTVTYSIVQGGFSGIGNFNEDPMFYTYNDPDGADDIWMTADDGLTLLSCSPAINSGATTSPVIDKDILNNSRAGNYDLGAYEFQGEPVIPLLASAYKLVTANQGATTTYGDCSGVITLVESAQSGGVSGNTTAKVWIESAQPSQYVKRHYEITPADNAATAAGKITLYFTQEEFDDFNAVNSSDLPKNGTDASGKMNLRVEKRAGQSSKGNPDATGLPGTYTGDISTIDPEDDKIIWNATAQRWEVTFDVIGFSGFFLKTSSAPLPVTLASFTALKKENGTLLAWTTTTETNSQRFEIQRSADSKNWNMIGSVSAAMNSKALHSYVFEDVSTPFGQIFYRLKMVDLDGSFSFSRIRSVAFDEATNLMAYPNPAKDFTSIRVGKGYMGTKASLINVNGKVVSQIRIGDEIVPVDLSRCAPGLYLLQLFDGRTLKVIKQ